MNIKKIIGDDYIAIIKGKDGKFKGYHCSFSYSYKKLKDYERHHKCFEVDTAEEAVKKAGAECVYDEEGKIRKIY